jgi:hypothetical protein
MDLHEQPVDCPFCGEPMTLLLDDSVAEQTYVEDCHVCCRPMLVTVVFGESGLSTVNVVPENE